MESRESPGGVSLAEIMLEEPIVLNSQEEYFEGYYSPHTEMAFIRRVDESDVGRLKFDDPETDKEIINVDNHR